ncbi:MAG: dTMP kinase [Desulfatibacillaceae bacterium]|nr:dTMP kinase [Desulfatibacillaceae bacterium]
MTTSSSRKGLFVTLEGGEGSGKTTQAGFAAAFLEKMGYKALVTREPGGTQLGAQIRAMVLSPDNGHLDAIAELFLYEADRAQHIARLIVPALEKGMAVVCDRFYDATVVYQGRARGLGAEKVDALHRQWFSFVRPDITLLFDLPAQVGLERAINRVQGHDPEGRFEQEALVFHEKVRQGYLDLAKDNPGRFCIIDAAKDQEAVRLDVEKALAGFLNQKPGPKPLG